MSIQTRILTVLEDDEFKGASQTDGSGSPQGLSLEALEIVMDEAGAAAIVRVAELEEQLVTDAADAQSWRDYQAALAANPEVTKLTIMRRLEALNKWTTFKVMLSQLPEIVQDAWRVANAIRADDPLFVDYRDAIMAGLEIDGDTLDEILA